jgi:transglutaminase-like putative cysteine protease
MISRITFSFLILLTVFAATGFAGDAVPGWLQQAAAIKTSDYGKDVKAVVLRNEQQVTLDSSGKLVTVDRYAVRILTREGRREAAAVAFYLSNFSQVRDMEAWLIGPTGSVKAYGKKDIIDRVSDTDDIYDEGRIKFIDASNDSDIGYVFGYTATTDDKPLFYQDKFLFQDDLPTLVSRYTLTLPDGWKASSMTFNRASVEPQVNGTSYTWELRDLPPIADEPMSPSFVNIAPRLAVNYSPPSSSQAVNKAFADWLEVSKFASALHDPQVIVDDGVAAKARDLTVNSKSELEIIKAIGTYVQNLQYISIDIGVGYGNGMKPRPSNMVLNRGYGDCKDKANLMRAMLKMMKIEAYPVIIYSGDPTFVRKEWASPSQFNHCIIAVRVSPATTGPTVIEHAKLGRLLIFDATDPYTPVGDLPDYLQGSLAVVLAGENGGLLEMPVTPADFNAWNRETEITLGSDGSIKGVIYERTSGQESRPARTMLRSMSNADFSKSIERWLSRGATAARLDKLTPKDRQSDAAFDLDVEFSAPNYGQLMQNRLLVFKPAIMSRANSVYLTEKDRKYPVMLESNSFREKATFNLPAGFAVDEVPNPVSLQTPFGKYATTYEVKGDKLIFTRSLTMSRSTVSVERYKDVRDFFTGMLTAEQAPVVLIRK